MKKIFTVLFLLNIFAFGQTISFDDNGKWTAGCGPTTSYQSDHQYNDVLSGFDVNFTGGLALRLPTETRDGLTQIRKMMLVK